MCLIAYRDKPGAHIPNDIIDRNIAYNSDGFGIAWRDPGAGLMFDRFGPDGSDEFRDILKRVDATDMEYVAHWRMATSGLKDATMAHPFPYEDADGNFLLAFHNGVIQITEPNDEMSDTATFVEHVLTTMAGRWWEEGALKFLVESAIGWSRFLLMTEDETVILNESSWKRQNGILYSTESKCPLTSKPYGRYSDTTRYIPRQTAGQAEYETLFGDHGDESSLLLAEYASSKPKWRHNGHDVVPLTPCDSTKDCYGTAACEDCDAEGEFFVIEGTPFIDINHEEVEYEVGV